MAIIGNQLQSSNYVSDQFSGTGSTVAYTLSLAPASAASIAVYISGLYQTPGVAYTVSGTTLTFTGAPPSGTNNIYVLHHGIQNQNLVPVNGSITPAMLNNTNVVYWSVSNNNVGIGNTTPTDLLSVGGTMYVGGNTTIGGTTITMSSDTGRYGTGGLRLRTANTAGVFALTTMPNGTLQSNDFLRMYNADDVTGVNTGSVGLGYTNTTNFSIASRSFGTGVAPTTLSVDGMKLMCPLGVGNTPIFYARQTSSQSLGNGVNTKIYYNTEVYDTNSFFTPGTSGTTSRFLPTIAGYYLLTANYRSGTAGVASCDMAFYVDGSNYIAQHINQQGSNDQAGFISAIVYLNGSQYVEVWVNQNGGSSVTTNNSDNLGGTNMTWWQGMLIRAA